MHRAMRGLLMAPRSFGRWFPNGHEADQVESKNIVNIIDQGSRKAALNLLANEVVHVSAEYDSTWAYFYSPLDWAAMCLL